MKNFLKFLVVSSIFSSYAAAEPLPDAGLLLRENHRSAEKPKLQIKPSIENAEPSKPAMLPQNNLQFTVKNFRFSGNTQFSHSELSTLLNSYIGQKTGFNDLEIATKIISQHYHNAGFFLALAYLPQQIIKDGQVEITILEGRLDNSHLTADAIQALNKLRVNKFILKRFLDTYEEGELITEKSIQHLSLLINDLSGIESKIVLAPGRKIGLSSLSLEVKEGALVKGYLSTDNHGLYSTGYYRFDGGVRLDDVTGLGDQLNLRLQTTETGNSVSGRIDYNLPINGYGTRLAVNFSELHYSLGRAFTPLNVSGIARTVGISLRHPLWLAREGRLMADVHYEHRWLEDNIALFERHNQRELNLMRFSLTANYYDYFFLTKGLTQGDVNVSVGDLHFKNKAAFKLDQRSGLKTSGGYYKFSWQLNRTQTITEDFSLFVNFQGQLASKNIDSSEQMSLGGPNAIRAYPVGEASADEGWLFNGEVRYRLPIIPHIPGYFELVSFFDTGFSRVNTKPLAGDLNNSQQLTGYGLGLNFQGIAGFNLRTSVAWRDSKNQPTSDPTAQEPMMYFQMFKSF